MSFTNKYRFAFPLAMLLVGCGSDTVDQPPSLPEAGREASRALDPVALLFSDAGVPGQCMSCVRSRCAEPMAACTQDAKCLQGFACSLLQCMPTFAQSGSTTSAAGLSCAMTCFQNDLSTALRAASSATCALGGCDEPCGALVPDTVRDGGTSLWDRFARDRDGGASAREASAQSDYDGSVVDVLGEASAPQERAPEAATNALDASTTDAMPAPHDAARDGSELRE